MKDDFIYTQLNHLASKSGVHLDLCLENVMLSRDPFVFEADGMVRIEDVTIKLVDFGCAEMYDAEQMVNSMSFECSKGTIMSLYYITLSITFIYVVW